MLKPIERQALAAYEAAERQIPDSDIDNEQPLTLSVATTLGEIRRIRRLASVLERAARATERESVLRAQQDWET